MADTKSIITLGALGIGAWWLYNNYSQAQSAVVDTGQTGGAGSGGGGTAPPPPTAPSPSPAPAQISPSVMDAASKLAQEAATAMAHGDYATATRLSLELKKLQDANPAPSPMPSTSSRPDQGTLEAYVKSRLGSQYTGKLTADQWNYYYTNLSGITQTADLFATGNRAELIDIGTYYSRRQAQGLNGALSLGILHYWY